MRKIGQFWWPQSKAVMCKYLRSVRFFYSAKQSVIIRTMLADLNIDEDSNNEDLVPLTNKEVTRDAFAKSLVWMEHNRGKPDFQKDTDGDESNPKEIVSWSQLDDWEKKYVDIPISEMFPLLIVGNFLEIKGLIDLICKVVALQIQDNNVQEIREKFNVADPNWSAEELQKLKDENTWAYETKT